VAGFWQGVLARQDPRLYFWLQESNDRLIGRLLDTAEPSPLARKRSEQPSLMDDESEGVQGRTDT